MSDWLFNAIPWFIGALAALAIGLLVWVLWWEFQPHRSYSLDAREWSCTHTETRLMPMMVGKVMMLMPQTYCTRYERGASPNG